MSDYLFDKAGDPDPEVAELERMLAPLAYRGRAPRLPQPRRVRPYVVVAATAALTAALVAVLIARPWRPRPPQWIVGAALDSGEARTRLVVPGLGSVELSPHTRARIVAAHELRLERGTVAAVIHAPPRQFVIDTPHGVITDLGCAFEVSVDDAGRGSVVVTEGRVGVAGSDGDEIVVAAGARLELSAPKPPPSAAPHAAAPVPAPSPVRAPHATPHHHAPKKAAASHPASKSPSVPLPAHATPAKKNEPAHIQHDALKDLQQDVE